MVPTGRPSDFARCAWQASSTITRLWRVAMAAIAVMSAGCPYRCTGRIAAVRGVTRASTCAGSSVRRSMSMSANTGVAPAIMMANAEYAAESGAVITSSPGPMPSARNASAIASVPVPTPTAWAAPEACANSVSKAVSSGPRMNHPRAITRSMAARMAPASAPGVKCMNGMAAGVVTRASPSRSHSVGDGRDKTPASVTGPRAGRWWTASPWRS